MCKTIPVRHGLFGELGAITMYIIIYNDFVSLLYETNRFHVAVQVCLARQHGSQKMSKCGKNISGHILSLSVI